jgi:hypothetical protein
MEPALVAKSKPPIGGLNFGTPRYESLFGALPIEPNNLEKYKIFISKLDSIPIDKPFFTFINNISEIMI